MPAISQNQAMTPSPEGHSTSTEVLMYHPEVQTHSPAVHNHHSEVHDCPAEVFSTLSTTQSASTPQSKQEKYHRVNLEAKTCTCKLFQTMGVPCEHALIAIMGAGLDPCEYYSKEIWPSKKRKRVNAAGGSVQTRRCSKCGVQGHYKTTCKVVDGQWEDITL